MTIKKSQGWRFVADGDRQPASAQSAATARHSLGVLRRVFDYAVQDGAIPQLQSGPSELVFPSANSTPLRNRNFRRDSFDAATAALGLTITPHNLRDTASSLAIHAGASVVAVARLLGHESAATTLNHYAGLFPTDLDDSAVRLDAAPREFIGTNERHLVSLAHRPGTDQLSG